jgi:hypothetical protein
MALQQHSASASIPSSTYTPLYNFSIHSVFTFNPNKSATWLYTTALIVLSLLALEQTLYRSKKRHLPGDKWTIPIIGKFADSMRPTMENYKKQWDSGDLSAISVFNMCIQFPDTQLTRSNRYPLSADSSSWHPPTSMQEKFSTRPALLNLASCILQSKSSVRIIGTFSSRHA